jgi:RNA 2',3'-cyclic 3'-phosphodiesterase
VNPERLGSPRVRLFVALELPQAILDGLIEWRDAALGSRDELRLLPAASLHVTLVFLGYQAEKDVERIGELSFSGPVAPFQLQAQRIVGVPAGRPRLFALALEDADGALGRWQAELSDRLAKARLYEPEKRPFWPHLTLARFKRGAPPARARARHIALPDLPDMVREPFTADRATLFKSLLRPAGAVYEPLATRELAPSGDVSSSSRAE